MSNKIKFSNIVMISEVPIEINQYFSFYNIDGVACLHWNDKPKIYRENTPTIFLQAMKIAFPQIHVYPNTIDGKSIFDDFKSYIIDYFSVDQRIDIVNDYKTKLDDKVKQICDIHKKLILHHEKLHEKKQEDYLDFWNVAFNKYLEACDCTSVERGIETLISCLETLIVDAMSEISYRTSLFTALAYTDNQEKRKEVFAFVKSMYNVRSKVIHGDLGAIKKYMNKHTMFDDYLSLKEIVSTVLMKMYEENKEAYLSIMQESIFNTVIKQKDNITSQGV